MSQKSLSKLFIVIGVFIVLVTIPDFIEGRQNKYDYIRIGFGILHIVSGFFIGKKLRDKGKNKK